MLMIPLIYGCSVDNHSSRVVSGVAAAGAAMVNVPISLMDSSQRVKQLTTTSGPDGSYSFIVESLTPPYILKATSGGKTYYSLSTTVGTANISPYTTMVLSVASGGVDMDIFYNSYNAEELRIVAGKIDVALRTIRVKLQPLLSTFHNGDKNPMTDTFCADHTGLDALFDVVTVDFFRWETVTLRNCGTNEIFYTGKVRDFTGGVFDRTRMPNSSTHALDTQGEL